MRFLIMLFFCSPFLAQNMETSLEHICKENQLMGLAVYTFSSTTEKVYAVGYRNEAQKLPITPETKFRIASISKAFTALGLMKLYDKKMFQLDDAISDYLNFKVENPNFPGVPITFRMLLSHTSSIQDGAGYDAFLASTYNETPSPSVSSVITPTGKSFTSDMFMNYKPGTYFTYCNFNYGLIGTLIEKISKQRFDIYMKNEILNPLGITATFNLQDIEDIQTIGTIYRFDEKGWLPNKDDFKGIKPSPSDLNNYKVGNNAVFFAPQGGLRASALDIGKFIKYLKNEGKTAKILSKKTIQLMKKNQWTFTGNNGDHYNGFFKQYGLGLHQTNLNTSDLIYDPDFFGNFIGHAGDAYGLISDAYFSEKQNFGFVVITNGCLIPFEKGKNSSFYKFEEEIFKLVCEDFIKKTSKVK
ncbi:class A beta-lactamase-related serine hydrolase [Flavobacterium amnicola]|uniref:Class A beta-lactamase-related serine hydrolase n=1 Tax=Flavobacterium amnicola TaxID=2506422 RepID=A0A4Q1K0X3_9FLAO|nr:serine hydrolase domain-containing protein [Flavobacterium amnicola]RXR17231.1 class A beta-lactamase-related serine hydrolase [Flavobacterium amnicola]